MEETEKKQKISELLSRGVEAIYPNREFLEQKLLSGEKLTIYLGMDPTAPTLHIGHMVPLLKLSEFQKLGHQIILLIGDFTATIGDPDKMTVRVPLTAEQVLGNAKSYKKQISKVIKFSGENGVKLRYNSKWLSKLSLKDILHILSNITYAQIIKRDMFQKRIAEGRDLYLHEFMYPVMQGYDSVVMEVDGEIGGNDQTFNMLVGRDLMKKLQNKEKFVITTKLLIDNSGKKMSKTEGNMVALNEPAEQMFGHIMSWSDGLILPGLELCTSLPIKNIEDIKMKLDNGMNPRDAKLFLAEEIVKIYHNAITAKKAKKSFLSAFSDKQIPDDIKEVVVNKGSLLSEILLSSGIVESKSDFRRLIEGGAIHNMETDEKISDPFYKIEENLPLKIGKHRFLKIKLN